MNHARQDMVANLAIQLKDQLTNPTYERVHGQNSPQGYAGAADAMLRYIEAKLHTPWEQLDSTYNPGDRIRMPGNVVEVDERSRSALQTGKDVNEILTR